MFEWVKNRWEWAANRISDNYHVTRNMIDISYMPPAIGTPLLTPKELEEKSVSREEMQKRIVASSKERARFIGSALNQLQNTETAMMTTGQTAAAVGGFVVGGPGGAMAAWDGVEIGVDAGLKLMGDNAPPRTLQELYTPTINVPIPFVGDVPLLSSGHYKEEKNNPSAFVDPLKNTAAKMEDAYKATVAANAVGQGPKPVITASASESDKPGFFGMGSLIGGAIGALGFVLGPIVGGILAVVGALVGQSVMNTITQHTDSAHASPQPPANGVAYANAGKTAETIQVPTGIPNSPAASRGI